MPRVINQIAGFLKMKLFGQSLGMDVPLAVDGDGHLKIDIDSAPNLNIQFTTGTATPAEINPDDAGAAGSSSLAAKEDHVHGFPCATPGTTILGDASAEGSAASAARSDHTHKYIITGLREGRFERKDTNTGRLVGLAGTSKRIEVGGDYTSLASDIERALTSGNYLLNADGSISASNPAADTTYYAYLLGSGHSTNPNELRFSATAPASDGYLGVSGDATHCRHVGWVRTNASTQLADDLSVISRLNEIVKSIAFAGSGSQTNSATGAWEDIASPQKEILWPPGFTIRATIHVGWYHNDATSTNYFALFIGETRFTVHRADTAVANEYAITTLINVKGNETSSICWSSVKAQLYTTLNTLTVSKANTPLVVELIPPSV